MTLATKIFTDRQSDAIQRLWDDPESKRLLLKQVSAELPDQGGVIWHYPKEQVVAMMLEPEFAGVDDGFYVGNTVNKHMTNTKNLLPLVTEHHGLALAERCLVCLGFFWDYMEQRTRRFGAPHPKYYMEVGQREFRRNGFATIAENMPKWQEFLYYQFRSVEVKDIT